MFGSDVIEIILGLGVAVIALGIVCAAAAEFIEMLLNTGGRDVFRGITELTNEPRITADLYVHPLIASLYVGKFHPAHPNNLPSYIPPRLFALALLDLATGHSDPDLAVRPYPSTPYGPNLNWLSPAAICEGIERRFAPDSPVRRALMILVAAGRDDRTLNVGQMILIAAGSDDSTLNAGPTDREDSTARIISDIEGWFTAAIQEVNNWGLRRRKLMLLVLGFLICSCFNVDPLNLANYFATARAQSSFWLQNSKPDNSVANSYASTADALRQIRNLGLPVGWSGSDPVRIPYTANAWLLKIGGFVLMSFAICACGVALSRIATHLRTKAVSHTGLTQRLLQDLAVPRTRGES